MLTQIEQALLSCNGDKFANICRLYLSYRFHIVNASGFVLGKEKSKQGTPDNFIPFKDFYIFNEITTQQKNVVEKLKKDIEHCYTQKEIDKEKIISIILICNSEISPAIQEQLNEHKNRYNNSTSLEVIGLDSFSSIIYRDCPSILRELGLAIDTGQILEVKDFLLFYEKSKFATPLSNKFLNRNEELKQGLDYLSKDDILLISGDAGAGKTKISLELTKRFLNKNESYISKVIVSNGNLGIWDDLKLQLLNDRDYLIIVDDANKLKSNLDLIVNFIKDQDRKGKIKLILTVRNYVKEQVKNSLTKFNVLEISKFEKRDLAKILQSKDFNISNYYVDRIYNISKGNPRIAIMAAIAGINKDIDKLNNASEIYEEYFSSVHTSIEALQDQDLLIVAGVISLLRIIDFKNEEIINEISELFCVEKSVLLEKCKLLHKYEIVDEYSDVYKIADQILGEYIFYLIFIKEQKIPFKKLLDIYYNKSVFPLWTVLTPIISNYGFEAVKKLIHSDIKNKWNEIQNGDNSRKIKFLKDFWFYLPNETLLYLKQNTNFQNEFKNYKFEIYNENHIESYDDQVIDILIKFKQLPENFEVALEILLAHGLKSQGNFSKLLKVFCQSLCYNSYSYETQYVTEIKLFDFLYKKAKLDKILYSRILLFIAPEFLIGSYSSNSSDGNKIFLNQIPVYLTKEYKTFRTKLWNFIFRCLKDKSLQSLVQDFFFQYIRKQDFHYKNDVVCEFDRDLIIPFVKNNFNNANYIECHFVNQYANKLKMLKISYEDNFELQYRNHLFTTYLILNQDKLRLKDFNGNHEKFEDYKFTELKKFTSNYTFQDYGNLFQDIQFIISEDIKYIGYSGIENSIIQILINLHEIDNQLFIRVFELMFNFDFSKNLPLGLLFNRAKLDEEDWKSVRTLLESNEIGYSFLPAFWNNLPTEHYIDLDIDLMYKFLSQNTNFSFLDTFFLKNMKILDKETELANVIKIILLRIEDIKGVFHLKSLLLFVKNNFYNLFLKKLREIEQIYLHIDKMDKYFDYDLELLKEILSIDPKFINTLLKNNFDGDYLSKRDLLENDFSKLWDLENYLELFNDITSFFSEFPRLWTNSNSEMTVIFKGNSQKEVDFLKYRILKSTTDKELHTIYNIAVAKYNELRFEFLSQILNKKSDIEFFDRLDLYVQSIVYSGSRINRIQYSISQIEKVKDFLIKLDGLKFLEHTALLEGRLMNKRLEIDLERKREFMAEWGI